MPSVCSVVYLAACSMKFYKITTLGCKVNQYESDDLAGGLEADGWKKARKNSEIDLCIVNTCAVTGKAAMQSRQAIRKAVRDYPAARIVAAGCYSQIDPENIRSIPGVHYVIGHGDKHRIPDLLKRATEYTDIPVIRADKLPSDVLFSPIDPVVPQSRTRPFLKIQDGCDAFCTYCIVPHARGRSRSMPVDKVIASVGYLANTGFREVVLTGIHLGAYGEDLSPRESLAGLLKRILSRRLIDRIRLSSIEPGEVSDDLIRLMADSAELCRHLHIPLQSGDDAILEKMHRPYTAGFFKSLIQRIRTRIPDAAIGIDVLGGFPGESDRSFEKTYNLIRELPISYLHVFPFSPRPLTPAYSFPEKVTQSIVKERCRRLRELGAEKRRTFNNRFIGCELDVLIQGKAGGKKGFLSGMSDNYIPVKLKGNADLKNRMAKVRMDIIEDLSLIHI